MKQYSAGSFVIIYGKEWVITSIGQYSARCERGYGDSHSVIVVPLDQLP